MPSITIKPVSPELPPMAELMKARDLFHAISGPQALIEKTSTDDLRLILSKAGVPLFTSSRDRLMRIARFVVAATWNRVNLAEGMATKNEHSLLEWLEFHMRVEEASSTKAAVQVVDKAGVSQGKVSVKVLKRTPPPPIDPTAPALPAKEIAQRLMTVLSPKTPHGAEKLCKRCGVPYSDQIKPILRRLKDAGKVTTVSGRWKLV